MVNVKSEICRNVFRSATSMMAFENFRNAQQQNLQQAAIRPQRRLRRRRPRPQWQQGQRRRQRSRRRRRAGPDQGKAKPVRTGPKVGRNDPCPCGSGKKYKQCCGK